MRPALPPLLTHNRTIERQAGGAFWGISHQAPRRGPARRESNARLALILACVESFEVERPGGDFHRKKIAANMIDSVTGASNAQMTGGGSLLRAHNCRLKAAFRSRAERRD